MQIKKQQGAENELKINNTVKQNDYLGSLTVVEEITKSNLKFSLI